MANLRREHLKNVLVLAVADGRVSDEEKEFILGLQKALGMSREEFAAMVEQVRRDPKAAPVPADPKAAADAIALLAEAALVDNEVSAPERKFIMDIAGWVGVDKGVVEELLAAPQRARQAEEKAEVLTQELYADFTGWDAGRRREKIAELGALGPAAVVPLLRILESYRTPDGANDALELKALAAEQIGVLGDGRAVYYLAQQVNIGDGDDEVTCSALRFTAAQAMGKIVGESFAAGQDGVEAARQWWADRGRLKYNNLII